MNKRHVFEGSRRAGARDLPAAQWKGGRCGAVTFPVEAYKYNRLGQLRIRHLAPVERPLPDVGNH